MKKHTITAQESLNHQFIPSSKGLLYQRLSHLARACVLMLVTCWPAAAQLTVEQKLTDFQTVVALYAKQYAPYEWKLETEKFDLYNVAPWVDRIRKTTDDLEYLQVLSEYVAGLNDIHSSYVAKSTFIADLHIYTDVYDAKVLIEQIDRAYLPVSRFPFEVGDEVVLFDGRPVMEVVREIARGVKFANERSTLRYATDLLVYRDQSQLPLATRLGDTATIMVRKVDGSESSHTIRWDKSGYPVTKLGPVPNVRFGADEPASKVRPESSEPEDQPVAMNAARKLRARLQRNVVPGAARHLTGFGARAPIFRLPANFVQRLGRNRADYFYSGTYVADGKRIGYIRISDFQPVDFSLLFLPVRQWATEIAFLKANTDGLVVDVMRNPGGYGCYGADLMSYLTTKRYFSFGNEIRSTLDWVQSFYETAQLTVDDGLEPWEVIMLQNAYKDVLTAYGENRGRTGPVAICAASLELDPVVDRFFQPMGYDKPVLMLVDEFTTSAGDIFASMAQDNGIATLYGYRTAGAGGATTESLAGFYSEGSARTTISMLTRAKAYSAPGYPTSIYMENIGIHPELPADYMTRENLMNRGVAYVEGFSKAIVGLINQKGQ